MFWNESGDLRVLRSPLMAENDVDKITVAMTAKSAFNIRSRQEGIVVVKQYRNRELPTLEMDHGRLILT